jgi:hypothetical protein
MDMRRQQQSSPGIAILSLGLTVPALLYILAAIAFQSYKAVTGYTGPYLLLDLGYPQQLVTHLFVMYLVGSPLFGFLLSIALRSESRRANTMGLIPSGQVRRLNMAALLLSALAIGLLTLAVVVHAVAG